MKGGASQKQSTLGSASGQPWTIFDTKSVKPGSSSALSSIPLPVPPVVADTPTDTTLNADGSSSTSQQLKPKITGTQNASNLNGQIPVHYGKQKIFPIITSRLVNVPVNGETYACGVFLIGVGPVQVNDDDIKIGDTPIKKVPGAKWQLLPGLDPANEQITLFNSNFKTLAIAKEVKNGSPLIRTALAKSPELCVEITFPQGLVQFNSDGARSSATVQINIEYSVDGITWTHVDPENDLPSNPTLTITDATTSVKKVTRNFFVAADTYKVRVTRVTPESTSPNLVNGTSWSTLISFVQTTMITRIKDQSGNYIPLAYLAVRFKPSSTLNGDIAQLSVIAQRLLKTFNGSTWGAPVATSLPAWAWVAALTGPEARDPKPLAEVDAQMMLTWANHSQTNGYAFNHVFEGGDTWPQALQTIAAAGKASVIDNDGLYSVVIDDKQTTVVQHFSQRNTSGFELSHTFPPTIHALRVSFLNEEKDYQTDEIVVYADGYNSDGSGGFTAATRIEPINFVGICNKDQNWKFARYYIAQTQKRRRTISFYTDVEHWALNRLDLVKFSHDVGKFNLGTALIQTCLFDGGGNMTGIVVDEKFTMVANNSYGVRIRTADWGTFTRALNNALVETNTLTFAVPIPAALSPKPTEGNLVQFGFANSESIDVLVWEKSPTVDGGAKITVIDHAPDVYDAEKGVIPPFVSGISDQVNPEVTIPDPTINVIRTDERVMSRDNDGSYQVRMQVVLEPPPSNIQYFESQIRLTSAGTSGNWSTSQVHPVGTGEIFISPIAQGATYDLRIRQITFDSNPSNWVERDGVFVIGKLTPPPDVPFLEYLLLGNMARLLYDTTVGVDVPPDFAGFCWKYNMGANTNWSTGTVIHQLALVSSIDLTPLPDGVVTLMVKAVDSAGNECANAKILVLDLGDRPEQNLYDVRQLDPGFAGTITNGTVVGGILKADLEAAKVWTGDPNAKFWTGDPAAFVYGGTAKAMSYEFQFIADSALFLPNAPAPLMTMEIDQTSESMQIFYKKNGSPSRVWTGVAGRRVWTGNPGRLVWNQVASQFVPWPGAVVLEPAHYTFRIVWPASRKTRAQCTALALKIDMLDVSEKISDVVIYPSGTRLPLTKTYRFIKHVMLTVRGADAPFDTAIIAKHVDSSLSGPLVIAYDVNGFGTSARVNAEVQGW